MLDRFILIVYLGFAASAISVALTRAQVSKQIRGWVFGRWGGLGPLSCPFCTSFYVSAALTLIYRPVVILTFAPIDLFVSLFAIVGVASVVSGVVIQTIPHFNKDPNADFKEKE